MVYGSSSLAGPHHLVELVGNKSMQWTGVGSVGS